MAYEKIMHLCKTAEKCRNDQNPNKNQLEKKDVGLQVQALSWSEKNELSPVHSTFQKIKKKSHLTSSQMLNIRLEYRCVVNV